MPTKIKRLECGRCGSAVRKCNKCKILFSEYFDSEYVEVPELFCLDNACKYDAKTGHMIYVGKPNTHFCVDCIAAADLDEVD